MWILNLLAPHGDEECGETHNHMDPWRTTQQSLFFPLACEWIFVWCFMPSRCPPNLQRTWARGRKITFFGCKGSKPTQAGFSAMHKLQDQVSTEPATRTQHRAQWTEHLTHLEKQPWSKGVRATPGTSLGKPFKPFHTEKCPRKMCPISILVTAAKWKELHSSS